MKVILGLSAALAVVGMSFCGGEAIAHKVRYAHEHESVEPQNEQEILEQEGENEYKLKPGSNEMLRAPISMADGLEVIVSDVIIPPNATVPRHFHPGEEFIYLIEGSVVNVVEGLPDTIMRAGETFVMPPGVEHAPYATDEGARAIVFRVHVEGHPERYLVE
ncbi:Cupin 2 conserved barrel domain protein [[Leptolyngbya] sp. PCC 7376]|uniref:cupin domain-containing protein n=1 Tax=[Leptolyngbya] sp. PCC 7376 TaxID=111781 RepID=UPI00029F1265|nr:cupin domain-containing protein [[Leptolyngbya] sp. PCC 7376]AFY38389.1 Cupin 2 conserved barrel domain protein [[Leptolyngbya] sp. PCC 7376]